MRAGWLLQSIQVEDEETLEKFTFPCERWLAKDEDDGSLMRELPCSNNLTTGASKESLAVAGVNYLNSLELIFGLSLKRILQERGIDDKIFSWRAACIEERRVYVLEGGVYWRT